MRKITLWIFMNIIILHSDDIAQAQDTNNLTALLTSINELKATVKVLQQTVSSQQDEIEALKAVKHPSTTAVEVSEREAPALVSSPSSEKGSYLPEIGAVADIAAFSTESKEDGEGNDKVSVRDFELVIGHDIDPYSRLDATVVFSDTEDPELEEAYASFWDLPLDTKLRIGRMKQKIGRAAALHRDSLDTVDEPIVVQRYLGAEGFSKSGVELSGYTPLSTSSFTQEFIFGVIEGGNGEEGQLFGESRRIPSLYARLRHGIDLSDETNADLGVTWLNGSTDNDSSREANAVGFDLTVTHFITPLNKLKFQSEFFIVDRDPPSAEETEEEALSFLDPDRPWGYYTLLDYRLTERWGLGTRWDWVQPIASELEIVRDDERAISGYLTFYQSEFARWRLQYQYAQLIDDTSDNRMYLQGTFAIGTHKHQLQ